jgi:hypothetical protein
MSYLLSAPADALTEGEAEVRSMLAAIASTRRDIARLRDRLDEFQDDLRVRIADAELGIEVVRELYWDWPDEVQTDTLRQALGLPSVRALLAAVGPRITGMCSCGEPLVLSSRSGSARCAACEDRSRQQSQLLHAGAVEARNAEVDQLRAMPYAAYLRTDHWRSVRDAARKRAHGRCQACNSTEQLDVHHRTYERRGCELAADVIVLCRPCHDLFHDRRALA